MQDQCDNSFKVNIELHNIIYLSFNIIYMTLIGVLYHIFKENLSKADNFQTDDEALLMILGKLLYRFN